MRSPIRKAPAAVRASSNRRNLAHDDYVQGIAAGDRAVIGRAITLIESARREDRALAQNLLTELLPRTGGARRVGVTGVPGVGKSTFIDAFGSNLTAAGHRVAVLAVDPSSAISGGSILGDKTRMSRLSSDPNAFIRPSPSGGTLGGVARRTRETMLLLEAARFDVVLVETVGVGQSETVVAEMVDFFLVLMLAGAGDELQGIKRGLLELADMIAINKADGDNRRRADRARSQYAAALHLFRPPSPNWTPPVVTCSGLKNEGLESIWNAIEDHRKKLTAAGEFEDRRRRQLLRWVWSLVEDELSFALRSHPRVKAKRRDLEKQVLAGKKTPTAAATEILAAFGIAGN